MFHGEDEVLASDHEDEIEEDSIDGRCNVVTLPEYLAIQDKSRDDEADGGVPTMYWRFKYLYNPDLPMIQCDECKVWYHGPCIGCTDEDITDLSEVYFQCRKVTEIVWR
ncbi:hypothetical protein QBZ16_003130 [Prototheca wickerhamii]|uniref:PHD-type domain-containing protein n=1 Tax=Prototheca wickerhamii TaxID=3111 RepID=A0AAD9IKY1_PROWI|nr:hypothetical protein QBZ16_003130 [Prototheca wickerhamii]